MLQVNSGTASRLVDMGPAANKPEAAAFRAFWGDKSEIRQFQVRQNAALLRNLLTELILGY